MTGIKCRIILDGPGVGKNRMVVIDGYMQKFDYDRAALNGEMKFSIDNVTELKSQPHKIGTRRLEIDSKETKDLK